MLSTHNCIASCIILLSHFSSAYLLLVAINVASVRTFKGRDAIYLMIVVTHLGDKTINLFGFA